MRNNLKVPGTFWQKGAWHLLFLFFFSAGLAFAGGDALDRIPVQSGGRIKPFGSFAKEALISVTGKTSLEKQPASATVWKWIAQPEVWYSKSFLPVRHPELREELGLMVVGGKISPELVLTHPVFQKKVEEAFGRQDKKLPLSLVEKKRLELNDQARLFQAVAQGALPGFLPDLGDPGRGWASLADLADPMQRSALETHYSASSLAAFQATLSRFLGAIRNSEEANLKETAAQLEFSLRTLLESHDIWIDQPKLSAEILYNRLHPFRWAFVFYFVSGLGWFLLRNRFPAFPAAAFITGFLFHGSGFAVRCYIAGRPPVSNMYESIIWVAFAAVLFASILSLVYRRSFLIAAASWVAAFALLIGESFPVMLDPSLGPLVPVLRNNYWLTVHVLTITLSYGAFALAWGIGHAQLWNFAFHPKKKEALHSQGEFLYRAVQIGVVLLTAGTILGGVWANASWGRFWGWDPKETWALIALLGYLAVLHGRFAGWLGPFGTALGTTAAFLGIIMAWYGVNFVLAAGFHSYGFGGGGLPYVLAVVLADSLFVSFLALRYNRAR